MRAADWEARAHESSEESLIEMRDWRVAHPRATFAGIEAAGTSA